MSEGRSSSHAGAVASTPDATATLDFASRRDAMVDYQIIARGIGGERLLAALRAVPRERFVPENMTEFAYEDTALPIEAGQTISQPYIVALMIEAAAIGPDDRVLEVGAGSGYAAAVMSRIGGSIHAIERHEELTERAAERLAALGYDNVALRTGDGTRGWADAAPFDVILVAAGGPHMPHPLLDQLAPGGRLVIPIGEGGSQRLLRVTRTGASEFEEEDLGAVVFVPLIGEHGWPGEPVGTAGSTDERLRTAARPLPDLDDPQFGAFIDRFADARIILLGEATHGTSEFYRARAAFTRRLIEEHGFRIVAVEADWPDAATVDRYVRDRAPEMSARAAPFARFPTWMWRNRDVAAFVDWLRRRNEAVVLDEKAGFFGLDLYSLNASIEAVLSYLGEVDPDAAVIARERYSCLAPFGADPAAYGRMAISEGYTACEEAVVAQLGDLFRKSRDYAARDGADFLDAAQNARLIANAEAYYRAVYYGAAESWNLRDTHMFDTLQMLLDAEGEGAKAVIWAHNSHVGDARATEMGQSRGELNLGQLCREHYGDEACLIGFGTHQGTVAAATDWGGPMEIKRINPSRPDSYEQLCHESGRARFLLDLRAGIGDEARAALSEARLERFIGVIYRPDTERWSHYSQAILSDQFDAWIWFDETSAVEPLAPGAPGGEAGDAWPFGL